MRSITFLTAFLVVVAVAALVFLSSPSTATAQDKKQEIDQLPTPVGGIQAIAKVLKYPEAARRDSVQGTVFVEATVAKDGTVKKAVAQKGVREDLDKAAIEAIRSVKFTPGMHKGEPVEAIVTIPIAFRLK